MRFDVYVHVSVRVSSPVFRVSVDFLEQFVTPK